MVKNHGLEGVESYGFFSSLEKHRFSRAGHGYRKKISLNQERSVVHEMLLHRWAAGQSSNGKRGQITGSSDTIWM